MPCLSKILARLSPLLTVIFLVTEAYRGPWCWQSKAQINPRAIGLRACVFHHLELGLALSDKLPK